MINEIAAQFDLGDIERIEPFEDKGNINSDAYRVVAEGDWLLQRINPEVFRFPDRVMTGYVQWLDASNAFALVNPELGWRELELAETMSDNPWLESDSGWWRACRLLPNVRGFRKLDGAPANASFELGRGLAISRAIGSMLVAEEIEPSLPGYRDAEQYWRQHQAIWSGDVTAYLPESPELRQSTGRHFERSLSDAEFETRRDHPVAQRISNLLQAHLAEGRYLSAGLASGDLDRTVIHGDTKLDNFLFDASSAEICALIDLDTVMPHTWLVDFGDSMRSVANLAGEHAENADQVSFHLPTFEAAVNGFLSLADELTDAEVQALSIAPLSLAWEQCLRFFTDYLRGDTYYVLQDQPADFNLHRAAVQASLLESMLLQQTEMNSIVLKSVESTAF